MIRSAVAVWRGSPLIGEGQVSTSSGVICNALYAAGSSTGNEPCTSPSEMLAAAVASCMSLMVVQEMRREGMKPQLVKTESTLTLEEKKGQWDIAEIDSNITVSMPAANEKKIQHAATIAKAKCPISRALNVPIIKVRAKVQAVEAEPITA
ncbi:MAG: OsmC family peroxiredoxin [Terriglobales bacterium]